MAWPSEDRDEPFVSGLWLVEATVGGKCYSDLVIEYSAPYAVAAFAFILKERGVMTEGIVINKVSGAAFDHSDAFEMPTVVTDIKPLVNSLISHVIWQTVDGSGQLADIIQSYETLNSEMDLYLFELNTLKRVKEKSSMTLKEYAYYTASDVCIIDGRDLDFINTYSSLADAIRKSKTNEQAIEASVLLSLFTHHDIAFVNTAYRIIVEEPHFLPIV